MFNRKPKVCMTYEEFRRRLSDAYRAGWKDCDIDMPFFNGYYIDQIITGDLRYWKKGSFSDDS